MVINRWLFRYLSVKFFHDMGCEFITRQQIPIQMHRAFNFTQTVCTPAPATKNLLHSPFSRRVKEGDLFIHFDITKADEFMTLHIHIDIRVATVIEILKEVRFEVNMAVMVYLQGEIGWLLYILAGRKLMEQ